MGAGVESKPWFGPEDGPALRDVFAVYASTVRMNEIIDAVAAQNPTLGSLSGTLAARWSPELMARRRALLADAVAGNWGRTSESSRETPSASRTGASATGSS